MSAKRTNSPAEGTGNGGQATSQPGESPFCDTKVFATWGRIGVLVLFIVIGLEYLRSDFWMDELITIIDYGSRPRWQQILRTYPVANNHILFSVLLWFWMGMIRVLSEEVLRFPCLLIAIVHLLFVWRHGRILFGRAAGFLLMLMLVLSPIYLNFFYQLRGYGLSIFLATVATTGIFYYLIGHPVRGLIYYGIGALLLPGVVPSNALVNLSLWVFLNLALVRQGRWRKQAPGVAIAAVLSVLGGAIYLPILPKVLEVLSAVEGWRSGWLVVAHWGLAIVAHIGVFIVASYGLRRYGPNRQTDWDTDRHPLIDQLPWLFACCLVPIVAVGLLRSPFPRAFLGYLAPLTFCALMGYKPTLAKRNRNFMLLIFFVLANGLVFYNMTRYTTRQALEAGRYPQNLLQQYYTRSNDCFLTAQFLARNPMIPPNTKIMVDFPYYLTMDFNWKRFQQNDWQIECLGGTGEKFGLQHHPQAYYYLPQLVLAYDRDAARRAYRTTLEVDVQLERMESPTPWTIYRVTGMRPLDPSTKRPPPFVPPDGGPPLRPPPEPPFRAPPPPDGHPGDEPPGSIEIRYLPPISRHKAHAGEAL